MRRYVAVVRQLAVVGLACLCGVAIAPALWAAEATSTAGGSAAATAPAKLPSVAEAAAQVDRTLTAELLSEVEPAGLVDDETFLRRLTLDVVGQPPSPGELTAFAFDPDPNKRTSAIRRLLADERFGETWARYWRDVIMYRRLEDRALLGAGVLEEFLASAINGGQSWADITRAIVTAKGNVAEEGTTALFLAQQAEAADVAAEVSRIFLGVQIQCAQCHDHPTDRWKREQFHEFAAFFPRTSLRPVLVDGRQRGFELVSVDFEPRFRGPDGARRGSLEHYMPDLKDPSARGTLMTPVLFSTGQALATGTDDGTRRGRLADWLTAPKNEWFAKAFVNRVWAELVGEGFYEPVDDMGPDRQCSAPQTLDYLAGQFAARDYDIRWLFEVVLSTEAYQRVSRPRRLPEETPFVANCPQRLRGDQVFDALQNALWVDLDSIGGRGPAGPGGYRAPFGARAQFNQLFGYDPSERREEITGSIPQALALMNSPMVSGAINGRNPATRLARLLGEVRDDEALTVELYLHCLSREPSPEEVRVVVEYVRQVGDRTEAFEDVLWALVNRSEFLYRN